MVDVSTGIYSYQVRLIIVGDSTVGKSSLLRFFTEGKFEDICDPTVGVDFFARLVEVEPGIRIKLQLWDTAGQERFRSITRSYYRNSAAVLLVYDITQRQTFDHLTEWLEETQQHILPRRAVYVLIGNKCDMEAQRRVSNKEGVQFARQHGFKFLETSAITGQNIEEAFECVAREVHDMIRSGDLELSKEWEGVKPGTNQILNTPESPDETYY